MRAKDIASALSEAQQAEALAPESSTVNATLGRALDAKAEQKRLYPTTKKH